MDGKPARKTDEEAARWVVRIDAGPLSPEEQRDLDAWLDAAPHHRGALIRARAAWIDLDRVGALAGGSAPSDTSRASSALPTRRWVLAAGVAGLAILGSSWFAWNVGRDVYVSGVGEVRRVTLTDGSTMVLNTATKAIVHFGDSLREVRLERGEALFEVQKDRARPFIVSTHALIVKAVGTAFAVRIAEARVDVTVTEGVVEIAKATSLTQTPRPAERPKRVAANQRAVVRAAEAVSIEPIKPEVAERQLAWRAGMVQFDGESLSEAVAEINRHSRRQIVIDDGGLSGKPVVGIFRASDVEGFAQAAATALGAEVVNEGNIIHLRPAEPG